jgi:hypothetical protein
MKGINNMARIRQEAKDIRIIQEYQDKQESYKNIKIDKNQARKQEDKNLVWRDNSCLSSQDSVYKNHV